MKSKWVQLCVISVLIAGPVSVAQAQMFITDSTPLMRFGPVDPVFGYPIWVQDNTGAIQELCFDTGTVVDPAAPGVPCPTCIDPALDLPDSVAPLSFPDNFPEEAFYFLGTGLLDTNDGGTGVPGRALLVLALEAAFDGLGTVQDGEQIVFSRLRIRIDNATGGESYTVTHPYGQVIITPDGTGTRGINITNDIFLWKGALGGNLVNPLRANFGTFLTAAGGVVPAGFIGDFCDVNTINAPTVMTGAGLPMPGHNVFRIEGPNIGIVGSPFLCSDITLGPDPTVFTDCVETFDFSLLGKSATRFGAGIDRATYSRNATATQIDVWANSNAGAVLEANGPGIPPTTLIEDPANPGHFYRHIVISSAFVPPAGWSISVTNTDPLDLTTATAPLIDQVMFLGTGVAGAVGCSPTFDLNTLDAAGLPSPTLSIAATSTNADTASLSTDPLATGTPVSLAAGSPMSITGVSVPPTSISVASPSGGTLELPVQILSTVTGPLAYAGPNQIVAAQFDAAGALLLPTVTLDGTGSSPATGLTYAWTQTSGTNTVGLTGGTTATPSFVFPNDGVALGNDLLNFTLTVTDAMGASHSSVVSVTNVVIANAGPDVANAAQGTVALDGTASAGFGTLTYSWTQTGGPAVTLSDPASANPTFVFPVDGAGVVGVPPPNDQSITFVLTVSGLGGTSVDTVVIAGNAGPPIANAGPDQSVIPNMSVQLDGSGIGLGAGVTWMWTEPVGTPVALGALLPGGGIDTTPGASNIPNPAFFWDPTIPIPQTMTFQLVLVRADGATSAPSQVNIIGANPNVSVTVFADPGKTQYDSAKGNWSIEGTTSPPGPGFSVSFYLGTPIEANRIGTAVVDGGGKFKIQPPCPGGCPVPTNPNTESLIAVIGGSGFDGITTGIAFTIK